MQYRGHSCCRRLACNPGCAKQIEALIINAELSPTRKEHPAASGMDADDRCDLHLDDHLHECGAGLPHSCRSLFAQARLPSESGAPGRPLPGLHGDALCIAGNVASGSSTDFRDRAPKRDCLRYAAVLQLAFRDGQSRPACCLQQPLLHLRQRQRSFLHFI